MEIPFLKNKNKNSGGGSAIERTAAPTREANMDKDLMSQVWDELIQAIETKNKQMGMDALTALVLHIQDMDQQQDQEDMSE